MSIFHAYKSCRYGIGIDTGGTCTDGVIADLATGEVMAKAKALTTHDDLSVGIRNALLQLDPDLLKASGFVAVSTTLATNSIVEGKGARVGLIMAVPNPQTFLLPAELPCDHVAVIAGAHNHRGEVTVGLDRTAAETIATLAPLVDGFAISSYFSIYNNEHELAIRDLVAAHAGKPAVCTHELSGAVGMVERAITAVLNARLLPVIDELVSAVEQIIAGLKLDIPLMIVKGDGSMMTGAACRLRPVETVLSGPAASIAGACRLSGIQNGLVVDMGGTTTDIAVVREGKAVISREGAMVGGWRTRVQAVDMLTLGAGGDSLISCDRDGRLRIGPRRAVPFAQAATFFTDMSATLAKALRNSAKGCKKEDLTFYTLRKTPPGQQPAMITQLVHELNRRVLSRSEITTRISPHLDLDSLVAQGYVIEVGFTPTDLLHTTGESSLWDSPSAEAGLQLLSRRYKRDLPTNEMQVLIRRELDLHLAKAIAAKALQQDSGLAQLWDDTCFRMLDRLLQLDSKAISVRLPLQVPIIAVGAPVHAHLPTAAAMLSATSVIPKHAEVANAYGAVTGKVVASASAVIRPATPDGYHVIGPELRQIHVHLQEAINQATEACSLQAEGLAKSRGAEDITVTQHRDELFAPLEEGWGNPVLIEMRITATASGSPCLHPAPIPI